MRTMNQVAPGRKTSSSPVTWYRTEAGRASEGCEDLLNPQRHGIYENGAPSNDQFIIHKAVKGPHFDSVIASLILDLRLSGVQKILTGYVSLQQELLRDVRLKWMQTHEQSVLTDFNWSEKV